MPTIADAALEVLQEAGEDMLWVGKSDLWHEAYARARGSGSHPMNVWRSVRRALVASPKWQRTGHIMCQCWGEGERRCAIFKPVEAATKGYGKRR